MKDNIAFGLPLLPEIIEGAFSFPTRLVRSSWFTCVHQISPLLGLCGSASRPRDGCLQISHQSGWHLVASPILPEHFVNWSPAPQNWTQCSQGPEKWKERQETRVMQYEKDSTHVADLEDGKGAMSQGMPTSLWREMQPCCHLDFCPVRPVLSF